MDILEELPYDGATFNCMHIECIHGMEHRTKAVIGLTSKAWEMLDHSQFTMRAVCDEHAKKAVTIILQMTGE